MAETLKIENFGPIKKANLKLGKTTIFIGEQSSGKSTIAKLIAIMTDPWLISSIRLSDDAPTDGFITSLRNYNIVNFAENESYIEFTINHYVIEYKKGKVKLTITHPDWVRLDIVKRLREFNQNSKAEIFSPIAEYLSLKNKGIEFNFRDSISHFEASKAIAILFAEITNHISYNLYVPSERIFISTISNSIAGLMSKDIALPRFLLRFAAAYEEAREELLSYSIAPIKAKFSRIGGVDHIEHQGKTLKIFEASSGVQSLVPLFLTISRSASIKHTATRFIIEEPELNLYPSTQIKVVNSLAEKCTKDGNQLVVTTHSPYVLTALNNLIFAHKTATKKPDQKKKVAKVIPEASWLNPEEFAAYYVGKGTVKNIVDKKTGLIGENHLDDASDEVSGAFYELMEIYRDRH